ncbi:hypothetical protein DEO72_LG10g1740 [Vigna unguiculata]|uniref:Uncharacterized protein n=1 Tax=Vigna unguiculata TaxID=3917 RepID=A0A4D6N9H5_VIGUN|nr:hypothetical protein DEO72_LG10g1740 [Vigna unguiculata]
MAERGGGVSWEWSATRWSWLNARGKKETARCCRTGGELRDLVAATVWRWWREGAASREVAELRWLRDSWRDAEVGGDGTVARVAAAAAMVMEGEEKIRVRVLGDEDDDVAESDWLIW